MIQLPETGYLRASDILGNPASTPPKPAIIPVSKSTLWAWVKEGRFPPPVKLGPRCTAWRVEDVRSFIEQDRNQGKEAA
jgi:predicted DNA-binding transcriptional regulator AlpA